MEVDQPPVQDDGYDRTFGYDRYGNRWVASNSGMAVGESHEPRANVFNLKNQMTNLTGSDPYDAAGNQQIYSPYSPRLRRREPPDLDDEPVGGKRRLSL